MIEHRDVAFFCAIVEIVVFFQLHWKFLFSILLDGG